jgi:endonuclease-3 related protein
MNSRACLEIFHKLHAAHGRQSWWPGDTPFEIMVGAVLTQNTAWTNVEKAITNLKAADALDPAVIVRTHPKRLASWLRPSGYFNIKAKRLRSLCRWTLDRGGVAALAKWPTDALRAGLLSVNGVGAETADDIVLYAFERPVFVIDAYTRRIFSRLGLIEGDEDYETLRGFFERSLAADHQLFNDYHALIVVHGKDVCRKKPACDACCLVNRCAAPEVHAKADL